MLKTIFAFLFSVNPAFADFQFSNTPVVFKEQILKDFTELGKIRGSMPSPLHKKIFGNGRLDGRLYQKFILERVAEFDYSADDDGMYLMTAGAIEGEKKIFVSARYLSLAGQMPEFMRQVILVHEARHNEDETAWPHVACPMPFLDSRGHKVLSILDGQPVEELNGSASCDSQLLGAYAITVVMARNIQKHCGNCSREYRWQAGRFADNMLLRIIDPRAKMLLIKDSYH